MEAGKLADEAVEVLSAYLRVDTTNPPGNEAAGASFLAGVLRDYGLEYQVYETAPGRSSLLARLPGSGEGKPLVFLNHIDVVPADPEGWQVAPFSGEISDGFVWGRGALDMKGMGVMQLMAFIAVAGENIPLRRDLVFLAVADEEAGGYAGVKLLLEKYPRELEADLVINEGGYALLDLVPGKPFFMVACAEKYGLWLRLLQHGQGGHGSMPTGKGALELLVVSLARFLEHKRPLRINPVMQAFFARLAEYWEVLRPYREDGKAETLLHIIEENKLDAVPALNAVLRDTASLNVLHAGNKINVIPDRAEAFLDCRLLPETEASEFEDFVRKTLDGEDPEIHHYLEMEKSPPSPWDGEIYRVVEESILECYPDAVVSPFMLSGLSDSRFFRARGVPCYGIIPARIGLSDLPRIHGADERISVRDVRDGVFFLRNLALRFCA
ncbi:M20/M25/M40 family metallo-hydrolase [Candidatus Solincola sp.]|nr:M20/M25/M40 family metallo-hydrolase [Actinomycetota bacterium]MDI7251526.1 M20/M25/M40 family metallo-hydrolase [Actinomycetota bacterium]